MKILGLETSASACSIGILADEARFVAHQIAPMQQSKLILPLIESLLSQANLALKDIDAIAFGYGPGSLTGVRMAASVAQGLAFAANLPVISISSLAIMAQTAYEEYQWPHCLVAVDARMDEVYWADYEVDARGYMNIVGNETIYSLAALNTLSVKDASSVGIGDGWEKFAEKLIQSLSFQPKHIHSTIIPHANALLTLAKRAWEQGKYTSAANALPHYLR